MAKTFVLKSTAMYKAGNHTSPTDYSVNGNSNKFWGKRVISTGTKYYHGYGFLLNQTELTNLRSLFDSFGATSIKVAFKTTARAQTGRSTRSVQWKKSNSTTSIEGTGSKAYASTTSDAYHYGSLDEFNNWVDMPISNGLPQYGISLLGENQSGTDTSSTNYCFTMDESVGVALYVTIDADEFTLSFNANGGSNAPASQKELGKGSHTFTISSSEPTPPEGFRFVSWNTKIDGSGTDYASGGSITISASTTLYAKYERIATDDVHVKRNGNIYGGQVWVKRNGNMYRGQAWTKRNGNMYKGS